MPKYKIGDMCKLDGQEGLVLSVCSSGVDVILLNNRRSGKYKATDFDMSRLVFFPDSPNLKIVGSIDNELLEEIFRIRISNEIKKFYDIFHVKDNLFNPGVDNVRYAGRVFDEKEMQNLVDSALDFWLTCGKYDNALVEKLSNFLNTKYALTVNSGSSANLLALSALTSHKLGKNKLKPGDEVVTVAAGFPTTVAPILQNRLVPVFVDIEVGSYNIDVNKIKAAISDRTKAIFIAHTLGVPFNLDKVLEIAEKYHLWVIEDSCDALGAEYQLKREYRLINGNIVSGKRKVGSFGHIGTFSFYPAHHITTGEGGAVCTNNADLYKILLSFRDWGRDCWCSPGQDNTCGRRFSQQFGNLPKGYDHKYVYSHLGYNLKMTDMQAAIGVAQMEKLPSFIKLRQDNWEFFYNNLKHFEEYLILPHYPESSTPSPFGFVLTVKTTAPFMRGDIVGFLESRNIQTRMIFAGNILKQPVFTESEYVYRVSGSLDNTDTVMNNTFWIGVYPGMKDREKLYIVECIEEFIKRLNV